MTGTLPLRERKRQRTQLELATAGLRLFREQGYAETTVDQIVDQAEYAQSTFFRHFATKEDIAFVGVADFFADFTTAISELDTDHSAWDQICAELVKACRALGEWEPNNDGNLIKLWLSEPALDRKFRSLCAEWEQAIATAIARRSNSDPMADLNSQLAARSMLAAAQTGFHMHVQTGADLADTVHRSLRLLGAGLAPRD